MTDPAIAPEPIVWEIAAPRKRGDPGDYVLRTRWFAPVVIAFTAVVAAGMVWAVQHPPWGLVIGIVGGSLIGLMMTLTAMAWAVAIVFADDTRKGLWFVIFPPYMPVYAVQRWRWMTQPTILFLCGLVLALGVPLGVQYSLKLKVDAIKAHGADPPRS